jgi:hypothetical protein
MLGEILRHLPVQVFEVTEQRVDPRTAVLDTGDAQSWEAVSVPWQMRLVIMSATSRWPSTIHRNALCARKFWVCGGSHFAT